MINHNNHHFYLYSNIITPIYVGGKLVQLLRYIPIPTVEYGDTVYKEFLNPVYVPVAMNELRQVDLALFNDSGDQIQFTEGRTVVTLHFRKRQQV